MQNLHITCDNLEQRQNVFNILSGMGYKSSGGDGKWLNIQTDADRKEWITWTLTNGYLLNTKQLTYTQFMKEYALNQLKQAIKQTGLSNPQLSLKLGHSKKYLTNLLNDGCSTALQERLIEEINQVMAGTFKTDAMVIAELSQQLAEAQDANIANITLRENLKNELSELKDYIADQERHHKEIREWNTNIESNNKQLALDLKASHQTTQNDAETILKLRDDQTYLLNKYQRQKRFNTILCVEMFLLVALCVWFYV